MTSTPVAIQPHLPAHSRPWNTLQMLKGARAIILGLVALLLGLTLVGAGVHRGAMKTIGKDTAPSIIAAQNIKAALADMDADAANELLTPAGTASESSALFERRRVEAAEELIVAAENVTFGKVEQAPIDVLQETTGTYERLVQQARDFKDEAPAEDKGLPEMAVRYYRAASMLMDYALLPAADELDRVNDTMLEQTYLSESRRSLLMRVLCVLSGLAAVGALLWAQAFLSRRTHRTLNPMLLLATALTFGLTVQGFLGMGREETELKVAKEDAFSSIRSLSRARAVAYSANADESRYLLDPLHAGEYQANFTEKVGLLAHLPGSATPEQAMAQAVAGKTPPGLTGYLADELHNITFSGEQRTALQTLEYFEIYLGIDKSMRMIAERALALGKDGEPDRQRAIALCIGTFPGQSDWAFDRFSEALQKTLDVNQKAFDAAVEQGFDAVKSLEIEAGVIAALVAVLVFMGFSGRIREYE